MESCNNVENKKINTPRGSVCTLFYNHIDKNCNNKQREAVTVDDNNIGKLHTLIKFKID